jgi:peptide/nickel transport system substrate-binding protein
MGDEEGGAMHKTVTGAAALAVAGALALGVAACGGSSNSSGNTGKSSGSSGTKTSSSGSSGSNGSGGGKITVVQGTAPDYLDPQEGYTTQAAEAMWIAYTPLYTYAHKAGQAGGQIIPGIAQDFPQISDGGKKYTMTIRQGLKFSDGKPVKASDFAYTVERVLKVKWGGASFVTGYIKGAADYAAGKANKISGIQTDDSTGKITIELTQPYGAFLNVLAFPNMGLVPTGSPMKTVQTDPLPAGVGPYIVKNIVPNRSYDIVRNPQWTDTTIPGIPAGHVDVTVKIATNTQTEAEQVLQNTADVFDWGDQIPPALLPQVRAQASDRFKKIPTLSTFYFFMNTQVKPFSNQLAREAVVTALDRRALSRLDGGNFLETCWFLPQGLTGHPSSPCPYGDPNAAPNLAKAKQLVQQSGMAGTDVTVWGQNRDPRKEFTAYYADLLNKIGFHAHQKVIADTQYFPTIGNLKLHPQTGFADWNQDFPNPSDFYLLLDKNTIQTTNNENQGEVQDPHIQSELKFLNAVPASKLQTAASRWQALDEYVAKKAYAAVYGQQQAPQFYSNRIDMNTAVFHPLFGTDFSSLQLKSH